MKNLYSVLVFSIFSFLLTAQAPTLQWQRSVGGTKNDNNFNVIEQTTDGGYMLFGTPTSDDGDASTNHDIGDPDIWTVKLSSTGNLQWARCIGGTNFDYWYSIEPTLDSGWIIAGRTASVNNGDITGHRGYVDAWVLKFSSTGNLQWNKCNGGSYFEQANYVKPTADGGYIIGGRTQSPNDGDVAGFHGGGNDDGWVYKLSASGNLLWQKCLGGTGADEIFIVDQTNDGGYMAAGSTRSNDGDVVGNHGNTDFWIVRLDSTGNIQWQKCFGGSGLDDFTTLKQTIDGGYLLMGRTNSTNGDLTGYHTGTTSDGWIVKVDSAGGIVWQQCFASPNSLIGILKQTSDGGCIVGNYETGIRLNEYGNKIWQKTILPPAIPNTQYLNISDFLDDGGYLLAGSDTSINNQDAWIARTDSNWNIRWQKTMGGSEWDYAGWLKETSDGGYIMSGGSASNDGDVSGHHGTNATGDAWVVKLSPDISTGCSAHFTIYPDTTTPHNWFALNQSTGFGALTYLWNWGDSTASTGPTPSHTYSSPAYYNICLSITDSHGCTSSHCDSSTYIFKTEQTMITVNCVFQLPNGIDEPTVDAQISIYPNPATDKLFVETKDMTLTVINIYNSIGSLVSQTKQPQDKSLDISQLADGVYIAEIKTKETSVRRRWVKM